MQFKYPKAAMSIVWQLFDSEIRSSGKEIEINLAAEPYEETVTINTKKKSINSYHVAQSSTNHPERLLWDDVFKVLEAIHLKEVVTVTLLFSSHS
jgi:hypothetical protein